MAMEHLQLRVERINPEAADIRSYRLVHPEGAALPPFKPGAHVDVHFPGDLTRQYLLTNGPADRDHYTIAVKREAQSRGGSAGMHALEVGSLVAVGLPRHNFPLAAGASHSVLLAGGIGITPLISMAKHLAAAGASFDLHAFTRSPEHTAFRGELAASPFAGRTWTWHIADADEVAKKLTELVGEPRPGAHLYVCGPGPFMELVMATAVAWPTEAKHLEYFGAAPVEAGAGFEVTLARSGRCFHVPEDRSIVQVLADHGVTVEVSCEQGICGTCVTPVLEGVPDHHDMFLTDEERAEGRKMTLCVSRAISPRLVLDL